MFTTDHSGKSYWLIALIESSVAFLFQIGMTLILHLFLGTISLVNYRTGLCNHLKR